tara:strand:- start:2665 stop:2874 length:210 start_codon:yes stop_codon:yes gene_type:complete
MPTNKQIREYLGHNNRECRVRIKRNGQVWRYGSREDTDRSGDYWALVGYDNNIKDDMAFHAANNSKAKG